MQPCLMDVDTVFTINIGFQGTSGSGASPFMVHMLDLSPAKCSFWDEVISFPSCGRLGARDIHQAFASICGACFHLQETQQTLDNAGKPIPFVHCLVTINE